jgi:hypothetical protein
MKTMLVWVSLAGLVASACATDRDPGPVNLEPTIGLSPIYDPCTGDEITFDEGPGFTTTRVSNDLLPENLCNPSTQAVLERQCFLFADPSCSGCCDLLDRTCRVSCR